VSYPPIDLVGNKINARSQRTNTRPLQGVAADFCARCIVLPPSSNGLSGSLSTSKFLPSASGKCGKCGIEAAGGVQLIYWQPDAANSQSGSVTGDNEVYTQVQNGFTL